MFVPRRVSLSHTDGAAATCPPDAWMLVPLVAGRPWNAMPFSVVGVANTDACCEPALLLARIISPAFVQRLMFSTLSTRASKEKSPVAGRNAQWNSSAVPQMSAPDPVTRAVDG